MCRSIYLESSDSMSVTSESAAKLPSFRQKFRDHLSGGTRPGAAADTYRQPWNTNSLIEPLRPHLGVSTPSPVAVRKWFRDDVVPRPLYINALLAAFFGDDPALAEDRRVFLVLWTAARAATQRGRGAAGEAEDDDHPITPSASTEDWIVSDAEHLSQGLAALLIHPPLPANDPNTFQLRVSLSINLYPDEIVIDDDYHPILLGLKQAQIVPTYIACTPAERHAFPEVLRASGLNDTVIGPKSPEGLLDGVALNNATLATMNHARADRPEIRLELHSRRSDLEVLRDDESRAVSPNKQKALQIFLQHCLTETTQGRVVWSRASLKHRGTDATD